jgi:hypothetical protein
MFRPELYISGLSWHTISWYYTFKAKIIFIGMKISVLFIQKNTIYQKVVIFNCYRRYRYRLKPDRSHAVP